ncbi:hypothetical protein BDV97DRAFT_120820 [Delphinella strobiligena]|nr:hypothetical protein BDV97DRAFT_120820 [Delphinella strobiligena]
MTLAIIGASGKLGNATLRALLSENLIPATEIVACTSSQPGSDTWLSLEHAGVQVRHANFDDHRSLEKALIGIEKPFLVSSPKVDLDYNDARPGAGREKHHTSAIEAARAAGVKHIYYSSLAFGNPSRAGVMRAHIRTEAYLSEMTGPKNTVIREGLYNESWPLYLGYYDTKGDQRSEILIAGDCPISWTSIPDLGLANALVLVAPSEEYAGKTFYLSATSNPKTLDEVARLVSDMKGSEVKAEVVSREEHEQYYIQKGMPEPAVEWWSTTYNALKAKECLIHDDTLEKLLSSKGRKPKPIEETIREMLSG